MQAGRAAFRWLPVEAAQAFRVLLTALTYIHVGNAASLRWPDVIPESPEGRKL